MKVIAMELPFAHRFSAGAAAGEVEKWLQDMNIAPHEAK